MIKWILGQRFCGNISCLFCGINVFNCNGSTSNNIPKVMVLQGNLLCSLSDCWTLGNFVAALIAFSNFTNKFTITISNRKEILNLWHETQARKNISHGHWQGNISSFGYAQHYWIGQPMYKMTCPAQETTNSRLCWLPSAQSSEQDASTW